MAKLLVDYMLQIDRTRIVLHSLVSFFYCVQNEKEANSIFIVMWVYSVANIDWNVVGFRHSSKEQKIPPSSSQILSRVLSLCNKKLTTQTPHCHWDRKSFAPEKKVTAHGFGGISYYKDCKNFFPFLKGSWHRRFGIALKCVNAGAAFYSV